MAEAVYILCALTSFLCALLLYRGYRRSQTRLLFWSCICFAGLAVNNAMLTADLLIFPQVDLLPIRNAIALLAMIILLIGLIWDSG
jgi:hypothetical protein